MTFAEELVKRAPLFVAPVANGPALAAEVADRVFARAVARVKGTWRDKTPLATNLEMRRQTETVDEEN